MKKVLTMQSWKIFLILIVFIIASIIVSLIDTENKSIGLILNVVGVAIYFLWVLYLGLSFNQINMFYKFNSRMLFLTVLICIVGYSELQIKTIYFNFSLLPRNLEFIITLSTFFSLVFVLYSVSKSLKSLELRRKANFIEYILDAFLIFCFPIGIWFIQPKIAKHLV